MFLQTAITVISFGVHGADLDHFPVTTDVYKVVSATSMPVNIESKDPTFVGVAAIPSSFIGKALPTITTWGMALQSVAPVNSLHLAFDRVGVNRVDGDQLLSLAKGILAEMKYFDVKVTPSIVKDPEENVSYLTLRLHVDVDFESTLKLDSLLTRELIARTDLLPENLSFAVYELE